MGWRRRRGGLGLITGQHPAVRAVQIRQEAQGGHGQAGHRQDLSHQEGLQESVHVQLQERRVRGGWLQSKRENYPGGTRAAGNKQTEKESMGIKKLFLSTQTHTLSRKFKISIQS